MNVDEFARITGDVMVVMAGEMAALRRENRLLRAFLTSHGFTTEVIDKVARPTPALAVQEAA